MPGTVAENCRFLAGRVDEVALLFLETRSSLAYTHTEDGDLPPSLATLPLSWHVHLPQDLPWEEEGGRRAARIALALMDKAGFLGAERAVLHPPAATLGAARGTALLTEFARVWRDAGRKARHLLLENTRENDLAALLPCIRALDLGLCLDFGHLLACTQAEALLRALPDFPTPAMVHWNAPSGSVGTGHASGHASLARLSPHEIRLAGRLLDLLHPFAADTIMVLELFAWDAVEESRPLLEAWMASSHARQGGLWPISVNSPGSPG